MRKSIIVIVLILSLVLSASYAETFDLSSMPLEELKALKLAVDTEYNLRRGSGEVKVSFGAYQIGTDIKAGHYYVAMTYPDPSFSNSFISIYPDKETYEKDAKEYTTKNASFSTYLFLSHDPTPIDLTDGCVLYNSGATVIMKTEMFDPLTYYKYEAPDGLKLSKGEYIVGSDIESGMYNAYAATVEGAEYEYTPADSKDSSYKAFYIKSEPEFKKLELQDGDKLKVYQSIILTTP